MKLSLGKVAELITAVGDFDRDVVAEGYSIDSRTVAAGQLFFAVKGDRFDGHDFVEAALAAGAVAAVVKKELLQGGEISPGHQAQLLAVEDTLAALQTLGAGVRRIWGKPLIAVTGSAGKTTTKEAIARVLSARFRVMKSEGNLNNHFGLPLQLLRLEAEHELAVIEMGMSHAGEIAALAHIAKPEIGVVTNVAPVHLEFFDSVAGIARAKYELIEALPASGTAVLNADDEYVSQFGRDFKGRVVTFGIHKPADIRAENVRPMAGGGSEFELAVESCREPIRLALLGEHNVYNALAAAAVGLERGMTPSEVARALAELVPADKRGQVLDLAGATVINDCYNSNPKALNAMVDSLAAMPAKRHIVVAGEMLELGGAAGELHRECGQYMAEQKIDFVLGVRGMAAELVTGARQRGVSAEFVATPEEAAEWLAREIKPGDAVLLKASRGVRLEKALDAWKLQLDAARRTKT
jgi:UDP-N-acetylmuramoyl-tripeptide--D-alanyl-D-alanine ligase